MRLKTNTNIGQPHPEFIDLTNRNFQSIKWFEICPIRFTLSKSRNSSGFFITTRLDSRTFLIYYLKSVQDIRGRYTYWESP
jgi:hypothetical protein